MLLGDRSGYRVSEHDLNQFRWRQQALHDAERVAKQHRDNPNLWRKWAMSLSPEERALFEGSLRRHFEDHDSRTVRVDYFPDVVTDMSYELREMLLGHCVDEWGLR
jgi:hypothetical protein